MYSLVIGKINKAKDRLKMERKVYKNRADGGTFVLIAKHETINGYSIALTEWTTYTGEVLFVVNRMCPKNVIFPLGRFATEKEARTFANREWTADKTGSY